MVGMNQDVAPATGPFDNMLCFAVYSAGLAFNRVYKPLLDSIGLTYPQYLVILALRHADGLTVGALGERLFLESNTLTPLIKRLEAAGFVSRRRDPADERVVRVSLTDKGRRAGEDAACLRPELIEATGMPGYDLNRLLQLLNRLGGNLRASADRDGSGRDEGEEA